MKKIKPIFLFLSITLFSLLILGMSGCTLSSQFIPPNCSDGTPLISCSTNLPYYCSNNGTLIKNSSICGCPNDYRIKGNDCELIPRCYDRTIYEECSSNKPFFCLNGTLVYKASRCGCPSDRISSGDSCVSKYTLNPKTVNLEYVLNGHFFIQYTLYGGMNDYLSTIPRIPYYEEESIISNINNSMQRDFIISLVEKIKKLTNNSDDQARIAISLVQNIPYNYNFSDWGNRYAYQVLYDDIGVCGEKSRLLVFLLKELGYGSALIDYDLSFYAHEAVGIKCPLKYSYKNSSYCFIESTAPSIITDSNGNYPISNFCSIMWTTENFKLCTEKLPDEYTLIVTSDGKSFDSVSEEYEDAATWNHLMDVVKGTHLNEYNYRLWKSLVQEYGIKTS